MILFTPLIGILHIGQTFYEYDRKAEHLQFLGWLREQMQAREVDVLLIAGDVFDSPNPFAESQKIYYRFLREIITENTSLQVIILQVTTIRQHWASSSVNRLFGNGESPERCSKQSY